MPEGQKQWAVLKVQKHVVMQSLAFLYGERWQDMSSSKMPATWRCKHGVLTGLQGLTVIARRAEALGSSEVLAF